MEKQMESRQTAPVPAPTSIWNAVRILRYLAVGLATFAVFSVCNLLFVLFFTLPSPVATGIAIACAGTFNFFGHYRFTFASSRPLTESLPRYCVLVGFNSALGTAIMALLTGPLNMPLIEANLVSLAAVTAIAYVFMHKFFT